MDSKDHLNQDPDETTSEVPEGAPHGKGGKGRGMGKNLVWTMARMGGTAVVQFSVVVVLSRFLHREELGWAAANTTVAYLATLLSWMGVAPAMIQRPVLTDKHLSSGIIAALVSGLLQTILVMAFAGYIAGTIFKMPAAAPYFRGTSLIFALSAISRVAAAIQERELRFKKTSKAELASSYIYGATTIILVLCGLHLWGVIIGLLTQALSKSILMFKGERIPKPFKFDYGAYKDLMSVGRGFSIATILSYIASNADNLIVSRMFGAAPLGDYTRAFQLMARPASRLTTALNLVLYPTMARSQDDPSELKSLFVKMTTAMAILVMPLGILLAVLAPETIHVLLGSKFDTAILPFEIFAVGMFFRIGNQASDSMTLAVGETVGRVMPKTVYALCVILFAYIGCNWGIAGVAWGVNVANAVHTFLMAQQCLKRIDIGWGGYFSALRSAALISVTSGFIAWAVAVPLREHHAHPLLILLTSWTTSVLVGGLLLWKGSPTLLGQSTISIRHTLLGVIKKKLKGKRPQLAT